MSKSRGGRLNNEDLARFIAATEFRTESLSLQEKVWRLRRRKYHPSFVRYVLLSTSTFDPDEPPPHTPPSLNDIREALTLAREYQTLDEGVKMFAEICDSLDPTT